MPKIKNKKYSSYIILITYMLLQIGTRKLMNPNEALETNIAFFVIK